MTNEEIDFLGTEEPKAEEPKAEEPKAEEPKPEAVKGDYVYLGRVKHDGKVYEAGDVVKGIPNDLINHWLVNGVIRKN